MHTPIHTRGEKPGGRLLSRIEINSVYLGIDYEDLAHQQQLDPETPAYRTAITALKWPSSAMSNDGKNHIQLIHLARDEGEHHPVGPQLHQLPNKQNFLTHNIRNQALQATHETFQPRPHQRHWPPSPSGGDRFLLTVNRSTQWIEATPMQDSSTPSCVNTLLSSWISRFGVPDDITTNRGLAFLSDVWGALTKSLGGTTHSTISYNPAANVLVERAHRSLKASLIARCSDDNWKAQLHWVLLGLRTAPRSNGEPSSAGKVYGETIAVPGEFFLGPSNESD
ncbi:uncharacterized protein [Palaemon carinicauda]|uniref:uncharacterized protein n=1 Tax=Palaemon carinicauda TaxID=392227 RepID=UPI0035B5F6C8